MSERNNPLEARTKPDEVGAPRWNKGKVLEYGNKEMVKYGYGSLQ